MTVGAGIRGFGWARWALMRDRVPLSCALGAGRAATLNAWHAVCSGNEEEELEITPRPFGGRKVRGDRIRRHASDSLCRKPPRRSDPRRGDIIRISPKETYESAL